MSVPAKKPHTEVQITMDGDIYKYSGVPKSKLRAHAKITSRLGHRISGSPLNAAHSQNPRHIDGYASDFAPSDRSNLTPTCAPKREVIFAWALSNFLTVLSDYKKKTIPWREALKGVLSKHGEAAAMVRGSRVKDGMTQVELAGKLGIPQQHVSEIKNGKRPIGKGIAKRLARVFRTDYRVFL